MNSLSSKSLTIAPNNRPIGIFDSGAGGLSIAKKMTEALPDESFIYMADSKFSPYGEIANTQIINRVNVISDWLAAQHCKAIVIACNTATVNAIDQLRERLSLPIIGVEPAIKPATSMSAPSNIAILVTQATANNARFLALVDKYSSQQAVHIQPCLGLVELIEKGKLASREFSELLKQYLSPIIEKKISTLVLGCTHYPFMADQIKRLMPYQVTLIETATPVTNQLTRQLKKHALLADSTNRTYAKHTNTNLPQYQFFTSLLTEQVSQVYSQLWQSKIELQLFPVSNCSSKG